MTERPKKKECTCSYDPITNELISAWGCECGAEVWNSCCDQWEAWEKEKNFERDISVAGMAIEFNGKRVAPKNFYKPNDAVSVENTITLPIEEAQELIEKAWKYDQLCK